jgi:hypothetical protein
MWMGYHAKMQYWRSRNTREKPSKTLKRLGYENYASKYDNYLSSLCAISVVWARSNYLLHCCRKCIILTSVHFNVYGILWNKALHNRISPSCFSVCLLILIYLWSLLEQCTPDCCWSLHSFLGGGGMTWCDISTLMYWIQIIAVVDQNFFYQNDCL